MSSQQSTVRIVAGNMASFMSWFMNRKKWNCPWTSPEMKKIFRENIGDYLNPLMDIAYELGYKLDNVYVLAILTSPRIPIFQRVLRKGKKIVYEPGAHLLLQWKIKTVTLYYSDIVNYLFITWQLRWFLETYKVEIEKIISEKLPQKQRLKTKQKQQVGFSENLDTIDEFDCTKYPTFELSRSPSISSGAYRKVVDVLVPSKSNIWKIKLWLKKSQKNKSWKNSSQSKSWTWPKSKNQKV